MNNHEPLRIGNIHIRPNGLVSSPGRNPNVVLDAMIANQSGEKVGRPPAENWYLQIPSGYIVQGFKVASGSGSHTDRIKSGSTVNYWVEFNVPWDSETDEIYTLHYGSDDPDAEYEQTWHLRLS